MPFILPEMVVESILRDSLTACRNSLDTENDQILDVFGELLAPHLSKSYGEAEINKIKELIKIPNLKPLRIVHGYSLDDLKLPLISLNLASDQEVERLASLSDLKGSTDSSTAPVVFVGTMSADSYDSLTGMVIVNTANPDLSAIRVGNVFVDGSGNEFPIVGAITNESGDKRFAIKKGVVGLNLVGCQIVSSLKFKRTETKAIRTAESVLINILTEDALTTKYLYILIKYFLNARRMDFLSRGMDLVTFSGSDFGRQERLPANVFVRSITVRSNCVEHSWDSGSVPLLDSINPIVQVSQDDLPRDDELDYFVQTIEDEVL